MSDETKRIIEYWNGRMEYFAGLSNEKQKSIVDEVAAKYGFKDDDDIAFSEFIEKNPMELYYAFMPKLSEFNFDLNIAIELINVDMEYLNILPENLLTDDLVDVIIDKINNNSLDYVEWYVGPIRHNKRLIDFLIEKDIEYISMLDEEDLSDELINILIQYLEKNIDFSYIGFDNKTDIPYWVFSSQVNSNQRLIEYLLSKNPYVIYSCSNELFKKYYLDILKIDDRRLKELIISRINTNSKLINCYNRDYFNLVNDYYCEKYFIAPANLMMLVECAGYQILKLIDEPEILSVLKLSESEFLLKIDELLYSLIINNGVIYDENLPDSFKEKYSFLFLPVDTDNEVKERFYNRKFKINDFFDNPDNFKYFDNTDMACALDPEFSWVIGLLNNNDEKQIKIQLLLKMSEITDKKIKNACKTMFREILISSNVINNVDVIDVIIELMYRIYYSNSSEIKKISNELITQLSYSKDPLNDFSKIEDLFLKNNIPYVGKSFLVFNILYPNFDRFDFSKISNVSPVLKSKSSRGREVVVFSDLLRVSMGSNNRSLKTYLENIETGYKIFSALKFEECTVDNLDNSQIEILSIFLNHLNVLYLNTQKGNNDNNYKGLTGDLKADIDRLMHLFSENGNLDYNLPDRIIKMFCYFAGFEKFDDVKDYMDNKIIKADIRNREASRQEFNLVRGDLIKGIRDITYLSALLQNGSVAGEYLGSASKSDLTPLDTDLSMILENEGTIDGKMQHTLASGYGPIWFVLKNDGRFEITRNSISENDMVDKKVNLSNIEVFCTGGGADHYGIRTGFASSEIDYIVTDKDDKRIGLEIVKNGFYIPVVDRKTGKLIFTEQDYDYLRGKMQGLKYYGTDKYILSDSIEIGEAEVLAELLLKNEMDVIRKRDAINKTIATAIESLGLKLKTVLDGNISNGTVELLDTGSTGRFTNIPGDGDFDYIIRLDNDIMMRAEKLRDVKLAIAKGLGKGLVDGDFRFEDVSIDELDEKVDVEITFIGKTDKLTYSTEFSLQERLQEIKRQHPDKYTFVVSNILLAKKTLKEMGVYKSFHSKNPEGGMGGVGIENWILQNGGSFKEASEEFLRVSEGRSFAEFSSMYHVWDFGENHLSSRRNVYPHDNFIADNMNEIGYEKMKIGLKKYLAQYEESSILDVGKYSDDNITKGSK